MLFNKLDSTIFRKKASVIQRVIFKVYQRWRSYVWPVRDVILKNMYNIK